MIVGSRKWLQDTHSGQSLSKPSDFVILQKYQSLSNQSFKHSSLHMLSLNLTPTPSFERRFLCSSLTVTTEKASAFSSWTSRYVYNFLLSSASRSLDFGIAIRCSWSWKSLNMADWGGDFLWGVHARIHIRGDISIISIPPNMTGGTSRGIDSNGTNEAGASDVITSTSCDKLKSYLYYECLWPPDLAGW